MSSEEPADQRGGELRSWWDWATAGLAAGSALVWLVGVPAITSFWRRSGFLPADGQLDAAAEASYGAFLWEVASGIAGNVVGFFAEIAPAVVLPVIVPVVGVWLALRDRPVRAQLGLATVAAWGAAFVLPGMVTAVAVGPTPRHLPSLVAGTLGMFALAAALLALRVRPGCLRLEAPSMRTVGAAAILLWGVGRAAAVVLDRVLSPAIGASASTQPPWFGEVLGMHLPGLVAMLVIATVVWRRDALLAVPAALVVAVQAVMSLIERLAPSARPPGPQRGPALPEIAGVPVDVAVLAIAAAIVVAATVRLALAARAEWHDRTASSLVR